MRVNHTVGTLLMFTFSVVATAAASNPEKWYGKTVTVRAKVDDVFARTLFEVEHVAVV